ncbi:hypothetical protein BGZ52_009393 [Haplosporangium bisporale]|nr:hypothetical protein BGZ52_009393 [Haplosporangium bisporale]
MEEHILELEVDRANPFIWALAKPLLIYLILVRVLPCIRSRLKLWLKVGSANRCPSFKLDRSVALMTPPMGTIKL